MVRCQENTPMEQINNLAPSLEPASRWTAKLACTIFLSLIWHAHGGHQGARAAHGHPTAPSISLPSPLAGVMRVSCGNACAGAIPQPLNTCSELMQDFQNLLQLFSQQDTSSCGYCKRPMDAEATSAETSWKRLQGTRPAGPRQTQQVTKASGA